MPRDSSPDPRRAARSFRLQAALILLPVLLLAVLAAAALKGDRQQLEVRAREVSAAASQALARALALRLRESLQQYLATRNLWYPPERSPGLLQPGVLATWVGTPGTPLMDPPAGLAPEDWALPEMVQDPDGTLRIPAPRPFNPLPPNWWSSLDPGLRERWEVACRLEADQAPREDLIAAFNRCRDAGVDVGFDANVLFALRRLQAASGDAAARWESLHSFSPGPGLTPAGVPLAAVVLFECLDAAPQSPMDATLQRRLEDVVFRFPSILTPVLLDRAARMESGSSGTPDSFVWSLQTRWRADERLRDLARRWAPGPLTNLQASWMTAGTGEFLVVRRPFLEVRADDAPGSPQANAWVQSAVIPERVLTSLLETLLEETRSLIPPYAAAEVGLLDRPLAGSPRTGGGADLARSVAPMGGSSVLMLPLQAGLWLQDPEALYAGQRRREFWTAGFILLAVVSALFGVLQSWRTLQRQLALHEEQSNFVAAVSHELRAPLACVRLLAEGLADGHVTVESRRQEYARCLVAEARRLGTLIENVLSVSRLGQGPIRAENQPTDIRRLVRDTVARFEPLAAERGVRISLEDQTGDPPPEPSWDGLAVQQALANLLDNALKHSPNASSVVVGMGYPSGTITDRLQLSVRDQGPGIPPEDHQRIFERFYRRGTELRRETRGVGLGLALVREVARSHEGRVWVDSCPGAGATFILELPMTASLPDVRQAGRSPHVQ
ncbi:MAG: HAMP domain-containing histidine kinase [Verrucomicrobiae bacterium]|nr:HAMP domain-containing histidine kinase [Verrucomicrobiae bacterium]